MNVSLVRDAAGRIICTLGPEDRAVLVTAADASSASLELLSALEEVGESGYSECLWREAAGDYRWMFRRRGTRLTVVALWSSGTLTGWEHLLHVETDFDGFMKQMRAGLCES